MKTPKYFSRFPDIDYAIKMNKAGVVDYITIKDYFHLMSVKDNFYSDITIFDPYYVKAGERPDQLSKRIYGSEQYYWVILQVNDIVDYYNDWPLSQQELDQYILKKYGSREVANQPHHYETLEVIDNTGTVLLPGRGTPGPDRGGRAKSGLTVPADFTFEYRPNPKDPVVVTLQGHTGVRPACVEITNRQYEYDLNEDKCQIDILNPSYISDFIREYKSYAKGIGGMKSNLQVFDY